MDALAQEMLTALRLAEKADEQKINCTECDPADAPETCAACFPSADEARVARLNVLEKFKPSSEDEGTKPASPSTLANEKSKP
jgi:hypothetical protein